MKTDEFWQNIEWLGTHTRNTCRIAASQGQSTESFERDQLNFLKERCERRLRHVEESLASNSGNCSKPGEKTCEAFSHTTSEK